MRPDEFWKNFRLGEELGIAGSFAYNGLRKFYEIEQLEHSDQVFEVLYDLSVGLERLLKIAIVLTEHVADGDQRKLEESLKTHSHLQLLGRLKRAGGLSLAKPHHEFLGLLSTFYADHRYDRFSIDSVFDLRKERDALRRYLSKHLNVEIPPARTILGTPNLPRYKKFLRQIVRTICRQAYEVIRVRAGGLNLYTYELRHGSKAETMFLGDADIPGEGVLWKELLIFFMNTKETSGYLKFLRDIPPLDFDPALVDEYLDCFKSSGMRGLVMDELEHHYMELGDKGERLKMLDLIGDPRVCFDSEDANDETDGK